MNLIVSNILDLVKQFGEEELNKYLSDFSCIKYKNDSRSLNTDIEAFLKKNSIDFARQKKSVTYLFQDTNDGALLGYFTITHKPILISADGLSNTIQKKIERYSELDIMAQTYTVSAFLVAQFGKNYAIDNGKRINGKFMMDLVDNELKYIQYRIGGGMKYLDCEPIQSLLDLYKSCGFKEFSTRYSKKDNKQYVQLLKFI